MSALTVRPFAAKIKKSMKEHATYCEAKKKVIQNKLKAVVAEYAKAETWSQLPDKMLSEGPGGSEKNSQLTWLVPQKEKALKKMMRCGIAAQSEMSATIQSLEAETEIHKKMSEKI